VAYTGWAVWAGFPVAGCPAYRRPKSRRKGYFIGRPSCPVATVGLSAGGYTDHYIKCCSRSRE
jgi:hypothetical protein